MSKKKQRRLAKMEAEAVLLKKEKTKKSSSPGISNMTNWLVVLVAVLPFIISGNPLDPALMPRHIFLAIFMLGFVTVFFLLKKNHIPLPSFPLPARIVFAIGAAYGLWCLLCMINSINYRVGYTDTSRHFLNLVLLYVIINSVVQEEGQLMKITKTLTVVALLQSLVGILQYYGIGFETVPGANAKPYGLMANRNFFGSAQVFIMPFVLYTMSRAGKRWQYAAGITLAGLVISITLSQTRSAWLSSLILFVVAAVLIIIFSPSQRKKWLLGSLVGLLSTVAIVALLLFNDSEGELKQSMKERAASLTGNFNSNTSVGENISERLKIWQKTTRIIKDHPLFGVGPGNWKIVMPSYGTENMQFAEGIYSPDRPHNVYLQVASETGIPGAVLYFGMWLIIAFCGFRVIRRSPSDSIRLLVILMLAGLAAVATDFMFSFPIDRVEHSLYMILMGGIIIGCYVNLISKERTQPQRATKLLLVPVYFIILFNIFLGIKNLNFEIAWKHANAYNGENRFAETIEEATRGKNQFAVMDESGVPLELFTARAYKEMKDPVSALKEIRKAASYHPFNARVYSEWGTIYTGMQKYDSAIFFYEKSLKLTPRYEIPLKNLAANYFAMNNDSACIRVLGKVNIENEPYLKDMLRQARESVAAKMKKDSANK